MNVLGVFARANHPVGYGFCQGVDMSEGARHLGATAHGYIVVIVKCVDWDELRVVKDKLAEQRYEDDPDRPGRRRPMMPPGLDPWTRGDAWYAGPYEMVWAAAVTLEAYASMNLHGMPIALGERPSYGDNRALAYLEASEVLNG